MLAEQPIRAFLDALASDSPTPGGGGAAAVSGALGAALVAMTANLTVGRKNYEAVDSEMRALISRAEDLREQLTQLIDADAAAFDAVSAAYKLPRGSDDEKKTRTAAIQAALKAASDPPFRIMEAARQVLDISLPAAQRGNANLVSDAAVAAYLAQAAIQGARLNVEINLRGIKDEQFVLDGRARIARAFDGASDITAAVELAVADRG
ncbi:MAG: cyclodeaminase/cyclohydrolase family protein [Dehalococcoidia bacterium]